VKSKKESPEVSAYSSTVPAAVPSLFQTPDPTLVRDLETLVAPATRGDPQSPLLWTCKSTRKLAEELDGQGHHISHQSVARLLGEMGYSLQAPFKTREGNQHKARNAQFEHINAQVQAFQRRRQPVISVDTDKKELVGEYDNGGQEWQPAGQPEEVRAKDFPDKRLGKVIPYGVYDLTRNDGWVSVGIDHDTAEFAAQTIRRWWQEMGRPAYPKGRELLITAAGGGSNGTRVRLWQVCLQKLADEFGLRISVCHYSLEQLMDHLLEVEGAPYEILNRWFVARAREAAALVHRELDKPSPADPRDIDGLARRQAHAAVVLLHLEDWDSRRGPLDQSEPIRADRIWLLLRYSPDRRLHSLRSFLIHRFARVGVKPDVLLRRYQAELDASTRRALLLSLGEFSPVQLPPKKRQALLPRLLEDYRGDPDSGLHSAADWLLRHWGQGSALEKIDRELAGPPPDGRRWYVTKHKDHTLTVFPGGVSFPMGSPDNEPGRADSERLHRRRIGWTFALATKEVTVKQFLAFLQANRDVLPESRRQALEKLNRVPDAPRSPAATTGPPTHCWATTPGTSTTRAAGRRGR
jgi:hypothetical protein